MRIAIVSDGHENIENLKQAIDWLNKNEIKTLIHCGDVSRIEMLEELNSRFEGKIHLVWGNADEGFFNGINYDDFDKVVFYDKVGELEVENKKIAWTHFSKVAKELARNSRYDLVFYGDTHKPWEERIGLTKLINPGNLGGVGYGATFAVYDFDRDLAELKILEKMK
jgi:hypothetical protein